MQPQLEVINYPALPTTNNHVTYCQNYVSNCQTIDNKRLSHQPVKSVHTLADAEMEMDDKQLIK